jgi:hypothetical protein
VICEEGGFAFSDHPADPFLTLPCDRSRPSYEVPGSVFLLGSGKLT